MIEINQLIKVGDIINSEGMILGLFNNKSGEPFLCSYLKDGSGEIYYSSKKEILKKYFNSEINLHQVYLESDDFIITRKFRKEITTFLKQDLVEMIKFGDKYYLEISESMRNDSIAKNLLS